MRLSQLRYALPLRLRSIFKQRQVDVELDEELQFHIEQQTALNISKGMAPLQARAAARRAFGALLVQKEQCRETRHIAWYDNFKRDLGLGIRSLARTKSFALTAVIIFALGISTTTTVFCVLEALLLRPPSFSNPSSMVEVQAAFSGQDLDKLPAAAFAQLRFRTDLFQQVAGLKTGLFTVTHVPVPDQLFGSAVTGELFPMLERAPYLGRYLTPEDERSGSPPVMLLSHGAWRKMFASDPQIIGKSAYVDGKRHTIVGVMPRDFIVPGSADEMWTIFRLTPQEISGGPSRKVQMLGRLRSSFSLGAAQQALDVAAQTLTNIRSEKKGFRLRAKVWRPEPNGTYKKTLWLAFGLVMGLLLIGCANLSSLFLARAMTKQRDYAIRLATGASRWRIIKQSLIEVCLLSFTGMLVSLLLSAAALHMLRTHLTGFDSTTPILLRFNGAAALFSFVVTLVAALLAGLLPAASLTSVDIARSLQAAGTQASTGRNIQLFQRYLVCAQVSIAMMLVLAAGFSLRSLRNLLADDHGIQPARVLTARLPIGSWNAGDSNKNASQAERHRQRQLAMLNAVERSRGVESAALASNLPLSHVSVRTRLRNPDPAPPAITQIEPKVQAVTQHYFRVMGMPLVSGRLFGPYDGTSKRRYAVVNEAFARQYFPQSTPIGQTLRTGDNGNEQIEVVGVVKDSSQLDYDEPAESQIFTHFEQRTLTPFLTGMVVKTSGDPMLFTQVLRSALSRVDPEQPVVQVQSLQSLIDQNTWRPRISAVLFSSFATIALVLASVGVYGVVAYSMTCRNRELGICLALGARPLLLCRRVVLQNLGPALVGMLISAIASLAAGKLFASLLYKTDLFDFWACGVSVSLLLAVTCLAALGPGLRIFRIEASTVLRSQ